MSVQLAALEEPVEERGRASAPDTARRLAAHLAGGGKVHLRLAEGGGTGEALALPDEAARLLVEVLEAVARGNPVVVQPLHAEMTSQEAAVFLGISRPYLVRLLETGEIPFRRVGTHRRVRFEDLRTYQERNTAERRAVLDELAAQAQELGLDY